MDKELVTLSDIIKARLGLQGISRHTPLDTSESFSKMCGANVFLKLENLQKTGSFKIRGAYNKVASLAEPGQGVVAASAGNHAQGVAFAAKRAGRPATIVMPQGAPITKVAATKSYGAEVVLAGEVYDDAFKKALEIQEQTGAVLVHAFDDPAVIAGQGTIGLELLEDLPDVDAVVVPIGGGGLISGIACAIKEIKPQVKIIGVQASGAPSMVQAIKDGQVEELSSASTIADGIAVKKPGDITFQMVQRYVDDLVTVDDEETAWAMLMLLERAKLVVEGAGAVSLAALLHQKCHLSGGKVAVIVSGGNIDVNVISIIIERGLVKAGRYVRLRTIIGDRPGNLQRLLQAVAASGANVNSIIHDRIKPEIPLKQAEVELVLETRNREHISEIVNSLQSIGYQVEVLR